MTTIKLRLRVPDGKPGDIIDVDDDRAEALVAANYAVYADPEPESAAEPDLPSVSDVKDVWVEAAGRYGVDINDAEGKPKNKDVLIDEVTEAASG